MPGGFQIRRVNSFDDREIQGLSDVLIDCVEAARPSASCLQ